MKNLLKQHHDLITKITTAIFVFLFSVGIIYATTTIGENIFSAGNLEISGNATTTGKQVIGAINPTVPIFSQFIGANNTDYGSAHGLYVDLSHFNSATANIYGVFASTTGGSDSATYGLYGKANVIGTDDMVTAVSAGVYGVASSEGVSLDFTNYGVYGTANGLGRNYGVYGSAGGGTTNYAGYFYGDVQISDGNLFVGGSVTTIPSLTIGSDDPAYNPTMASSTIIMSSGPNGNQGGCIVMPNSAGVTKYLTIEGDTLTVSDTDCR